MNEAHYFPDLMAMRQRAAHFLANAATRGETKLANDVLSLLALIETQATDQGTDRAPAPMQPQAVRVRGVSLADLRACRPTRSATPPATPPIVLRAGALATRGAGCRVPGCGWVRGPRDALAEGCAAGGGLTPPALLKAQR